MNVGNTSQLTFIFSKSLKETPEKRPEICSKLHQNDVNDVNLKSIILNTNKNYIIIILYNKLHIIYIG